MAHVLKIGSSGTGRKQRAGRTRAEARARNAEPRASLYDEVTERIVAELEAGRFPWVQPWDSAVASPGLPRNAVTGRSYSGVNVLILWGEVIAKAYASQAWLTFRQALAAGGAVRKGERGVRANAPLEPKKPQRAIDHGLFDTNARNQIEMF